MGMQEQMLTEPTVAEEREAALASPNLKLSNVSKQMGQEQGICMEACSVLQKLGA